LLKTGEFDKYMLLRTKDSTDICYKD